MTHKERESRRNEMKAYKAEGHTMQEVADRFGVSKGYAQQICKGIAPQKSIVVNYRNQYTTGKFDRVANAKRYIEERTPQFEYAGNFTGIDGFVDLKCKVCGTITKKSFVSVKHGTASCKACADKKRKQEKEEKLEKQKAQQRANKKEKVRQRMLSSEYVQIGMKQCPICKGLYVGKRKYCSKKCREQNHWRMKDGYRYLFPLEEVYERDNGICYLCGKLCDWNDKEEKNGVIVYGNNYPSRDHVKAKSNGGKNTWDNIRLAHRLCNSLKADSPYVKNFQ